jgi:hypothetical protein
MVLNDQANAKVYDTPLTNSTRQTPPLKPFICRTCSRAFARLEHLTRHGLSHTKEKPFECRQCARSFACRDLVVRHQLNLHKAERSSGTRGENRDVDIGPAAQKTRDRVINSSATVTLVQPPEGVASTRSSPQSRSDDYQGSRPSRTIVSSPFNKMGSPADANSRIDEISASNDSAPSDSLTKRGHDEDYHSLGSSINIKNDSSIDSGHDTHNYETDSRHLRSTFDSLQ